MPTIKKQTHRVETVTLFLTAQDILDLLRGKYSISSLVKSQTIAKAKIAEIYFTVPSGGDYSGIRLNLKEEKPIEVVYTIETLSVE